MTHEDQWMAYNEMLFHDSHTQELKLRELAEQAADHAGGGGIPFGNGEQRIQITRDGGRGYHELRVNLYERLADRNARVLVAEQILRPQLRKFGWRV